MEELKIELHGIFEKRKQQYNSLYDSSDGLNVKLTNRQTFDKINEEFIDELILKANAYLDENSEESKTEAENIIKDFVLKFNTVWLKPNE